ncbi:hypothetical protein D9757_004035 [Collybiopsis confluens]|uniref:Uncharacterized protein n=1 Tax=Collybiopsis confluens TaxID=2823264 RepID=A0A8H5HWJ7_9AGAR|nr:hypothetical protein D9757_004035 [Collybiopsis confluens]
MLSMTHIPLNTFHGDPTNPTKARPVLVKIFDGFKKAKRDPSTAIDSSITQGVESSLEPPIKPPDSSSDTASTSPEDDDEEYIADDARSIVTVPGVVPEHVENPPFWFSDGPFSSLAVNPVAEIDRLNRWFSEVHIGSASDKGIAPGQNAADDDDDIAESIKLCGPARPRFGQSKQTGVSPAVPPTEKRSFFWRAHEQSKKFLWAFLLGNDKLMCAVTGEQVPLQSAHFLQVKCPSVTRVRIMKAIQGAFCGNSRLNLIPLMANIHIKWDADLFLIFLMDKSVLEDLDAYLTFLDDRGHLNEAYDWFQHLRIHHPLLHEGNLHKIGFLSRSVSAHRFIPVPKGKRARAEYYDSTLPQTQEETTEISRGSYETYAHPVFVVLRFIETVMSTQSRAWVDDNYDAKALWDLWTEVDSHLELLELNLKVARHLLRRMGTEADLIWDERALKDKQTGVVSWAAGTSGAGKGTGKGQHSKGHPRQRAVDGGESSLEKTEAGLLVEGWRLANESGGKLSALRQFRESLQVPKRFFLSLPQARRSQASLA